ncbi:MAG: hypothetical protein IKI30_07375 [Oxalobacter sp.]|nr:hypothetical protein [Oxalobacter sp.]
MFSVDSIPGIPGLVVKQFTQVKEIHVWVSPRLRPGCLYCPAETVRIKVTPSTGCPSPIMWTAPRSSTGTSHPEASEPRTFRPCPQVLDIALDSIWCLIGGGGGS